MTGAENKTAGMPEIIFGTYKLENGSPAAEAVREALSAGFRAFDCAYSYGNDFYVGRGLKESGIPREELFVTNKLWKSFRGREKTVELCKKSLKLMKLSYFDLYLVHWPCPVTEDGWEEINLDTWAGMEALYAEGLVRHIGVSNYKPHHLEALMKGGILMKPEVNQVECHPGFVPEETVAYCKAQGIVPQGWRPFGKDAGAAADPLVAEIAAGHDATPAQVCLAYVRAKGLTPVCRTKTPERMKENLGALSLRLSEEDVARIDAMEQTYASGYDADTHPPAD
ncbi:MAG: aldo/keto reductase [Lachnospiraceae bacterium]|nr:aldo/keto reductase [Lachnospiraceae bacterium]